MKTQTTFLALVAALSFQACDDHAEGKPTATVSDVEDTTQNNPATEPAEATTPSSSKKFAIRPANSSVEFTGAKVTGSHDGGFKDFEGTAVVDTENLANSEIGITIQTASIYTDTNKLTQHLKSPDFFNVEKIPTATFSSTKINKSDSKQHTHDITGDLTLHGVTKSITFPASITSATSGIKADAEFVIDRKDFGIVYPGMPDDLIKDQVVIKLSLALSESKTEG